MNGWQMTTCEVCRLVDGDYSVKPCRFCSMCRAWICAADLPNLARRARAMLLRKLGR